MAMNVLVSKERSLCYVNFALLKVMELAETPKTSETRNYGLLAKFLILYTIESHCLVYEPNEEILISLCQLIRTLRSAH